MALEVGLQTNDIKTRENCVEFANTNRRRAKDAMRTCATIARKSQAFSAGEYSCHGNVEWSPTDHQQGNNHAHIARGGGGDV